MILEGYIELVKQEGGYCSDAIEIKTNKDQLYYMQDDTKHLDGEIAENFVFLGNTSKKKIRITVEEI